MTFTYKDLAAAQSSLNEWAQRLRLSDWKITLHISRSHDMPMEGKVGAVKWFAQQKDAIIHLLDPIDYPPHSWDEQDHEITLVHELLHLHYVPFDTTKEGSLAETMLEQSIHILSTLLVTQQREYWHAIQDVDV